VWPGDALGVGSPLGAGDALAVGLAADATGAGLTTGCRPEGCAPPETPGARDADGVAAGADAGDGTGLPGDARIGAGVAVPDCRWERGCPPVPVPWCDVVASAMPTPPPRIVTAAGSPINHMRVRGKLIVTSG
jgi:hypothetical protein